MSFSVFRGPKLGGEGGREKRFWKGRGEEGEGKGPKCRLFWAEDGYSFIYLRFCLILAGSTFPPSSSW